MAAEDSTGGKPLKYAELNKRTEMAAILCEAATAEGRTKIKLEARPQAAGEEAEARARGEAAAAERAQLEAAAEAAKLVGKQVQIHGLKARPDANGAVGYVLSAAANGRCTVAVKLADALEQLALKPANLTVQE